MIITAQVSLRRQIIASGLGFITLLCATLVYLTCGFVVCHGVPDVDDGPLLVFAVFLFSATPAILSTLVALALVGPGHCKLAWVSLSMYLPFLFGAVFFALWEPSH
jgi:hypothetical protein